MDDQPMIPGLGPAPATEAGPAAGYRDVCKRCLGAGRVRRRYRCFTCKGLGYIVRKTSPEVRAKAAEYRTKVPQNNWEKFRAEFDLEAAWIARAGVTFEFARKMQKAVEDYGSLTTGQMDAVRRCMNRERYKR